MAVFYSLLSAQPSVSAGDRIGVGLVMIDPAKRLALARHSRRKLAIIRDLIGQSGTRNLRWTLEGIERLTSEATKKELFASETFDDSVFTSEYLAYLSRYQSNLLLVDTPRRIDVDFTESNFNLLFHRLVDATPLSPPTEKATQQRFEQLKRENWVIRHFRKDISIDQRIYANVLFPVKVDLAGKNEQLTTAKLVATDRPVHYIYQDAHSFTSLLKQADEAKHFLISSEPNQQINPRQHDAWAKVRDAFKEQYLDLTEIERLKEYAEVHSVAPIPAKNEEEE